MNDYKLEKIIKESWKQYKVNLIMSTSDSEAKMIKKWCSGKINASIFLEEFIYLKVYFFICYLLKEEEEKGLKKIHFHRGYDSSEKVREFRRKFRLEIAQIEQKMEELQAASLDRIGKTLEKYFKEDDSCEFDRTEMVLAHKEYIAECDGIVNQELYIKLPGIRKVFLKRQREKLIKNVFEKEKRDKLCITEEFKKKLKKDYDFEKDFTVKDFNDYVDEILKAIFIHENKYKSVYEPWEDIKYDELDELLINSNWHITSNSNGDQKMKNFYLMIIFMAVILYILF